MAEIEEESTRLVVHLPEGSKCIFAQSDADFTILDYEQLLVHKRWENGVKPRDVPPEVVYGYFRAGSYLYVIRETQ